MESDSNRVYRVLQGTGYYNKLLSTGLYWGILEGGDTETKHVGLRKFSVNIFNHPEQKVLSKLNFFRFMGRFLKKCKKNFSSF